MSRNSNFNKVVFPILISIGFLFEEAFMYNIILGKPLLKLFNSGLFHFLCKSKDSKIIKLKKGFIMKKESVLDNINFKELFKKCFTLG